MMQYNSWEELIAESELNMAKLAEDKDSCFQIYNFMKEHFRTCLENHDYFRLLELLPYFEDPDSYPQLHHSGETMRINFCLHMLKCEQAHNKTPFISSTSSYEEFISQYTFTLFALRRLELMLSTESVNEALEYLSSVPLNVYAVSIIVENEYFENYENVYWNLYLQTKETWPLADQFQLLTRIADTTTSMKILLELAHLCLQGNNITKALIYLKRISSPTPEIQALISSLKELSPNEQP